MTRLLMLDFDEHLVSAVTRTLSEEGVDVVAVFDIARAREEARQQRFDVALLDCDLIDATELAAFSQLPVILTTSFLEPEGQHRFFRRARLLRKPFTSAQLLAALRATCANQDFEDASLLDVLRRAHGQRQTVSLKVGRARVFMESGELVHAEFDGATGEEALAEILAEHSADEVLRCADSAEERSIRRPFQALTLELLRHIEERELRESERAAADDETTNVFRKGSS
jgi:DNA-binding response OmpR family regulator